jgi:murein DD-endopeptidase MepM/ murein hydrolase activator NlpD
MSSISWKKTLLIAVLGLIVPGLLLRPAYAQSGQADTPPQPTQTQEVLELTFPAASDHPASDWRAPLYPIPFALSLHDHFYLDRPIGVDAVNWPLPEYRYGYVESETENPHTGVDIDAALHTPILAAADGKVIFAGYGLALGKGNTKDPYGLAVVIRHNFSFEGQSILTVYAHMEKILVKEGQNVQTGETIGNVGITGNTTGPHVHFEVRLEKDGTYTIQNPELWMAPPLNSGLLVGQIKDNYGSFLAGREIRVKSLNSGESWTIYTYASQIMHNDAYYKENLVLGDLPAGEYEITFQNNYKYNKLTVSVFPGAVTSITYSPKNGFQIEEPEIKDILDFVVPVQ